MPEPRVIELDAETEVEIPEGMTPNEVRAMYATVHGATPEIRADARNRYSRIATLREEGEKDLAPGSQFQRVQQAEINE